MLGTAGRKRWGAVAYAIIGLVALALGWYLVRYFEGLRNLGYVDSAIGTMRTLTAAEEKFSETHPSLGYTCKLVDLTTDPIIASGQKNEYIFEIIDCRARSVDGPNANYRLTARPLRATMPAFCCDQSGILKADYGGSTIDCVKSGKSL
jgi:hypothetical protein